MEEIFGINNMRWIFDILIALGLNYAFYPYYLPVITRLFNIEMYDNSKWLDILFSFTIITVGLAFLSHKFITIIFI